MNWFINLKIGQRLLSVMLVLFLIILGSNVFNFTRLSTINEDAKLAKDESLVFALYAHDFQTSVIQVQQWLTDISATRGIEGYDDGFTEAEKYYQNGLELLNKFNAMFLEEDDKEITVFVKNIRHDFIAFYDIGKKMAQQYIDYGPEKGNVIMDDFDPFAEKISEGVEYLVKSKTNELISSMEDVQMAASSSKRLAVFTTLFILGFIGITSFFLVRSITKPINNVVAVIKDIAQGEGDLTVRLEAHSNDELGDLAKWFNTFVEKLRGLIKNVVNIANQIGNASDQISTASEQLASGAEEQQSQLSEVATSMEQMSAMILQSSKSAGETQENADTASKAADGGRKSVNDAVAGIEGVATIVNSAAEQISALEARSKEIGDVIQVIDDIADQTNLLALNANIEAARAGDAGRGFAVVADEVRKLAERTVSATAEIGQKINQIQTDVGSSVQAMGKITEQSQENQALASQSGQALEEIVASIENVNQAVVQIASATDEQSSGAEQISKNIEGVSTVAKQAASGAQELAASAEQLNREVVGLNDLVGQFKV